MSLRFACAGLRPALRVGSCAVRSALTLAVALALVSCASAPDAAPRGAATTPPISTTAGPTTASPTPGVPIPAAGTSSPTALVWVNGMGCPLCANNVDQQLKALRGVEDVTINLGTGLVQVALSPTTPPTEAQLAKAVQNTGFTLVSIQMPASAAAQPTGAAR